MNRQNKIVVTVSIIIALALVLGIVGSQMGFFAITGSSTLSLTQASLQSSNPYLNGKVWLLTFSAGGLGQTYYGTITPSQVDAQTSDSSRTTKNLNIKVEYADESCQYPIERTGFTPIYDIKSYSYTYIPLISSCDLSTGASKAQVSQSNILFVYKPAVSTTCKVVYTTGLSPVGSMGNGNVHAPYTITLDVDGKIASKTIDPLGGSSQGAIGDYAYSIWNGNLVSGVSCPATYDYRASYVNGFWRIIDKQAYDNYVNIWNQQGAYTSWTLSRLDEWVTQVQTYASQARVTRTFGTIDSSNTLDNAIAKVSLSSPLQFPVTTLYIKADTLGIYTPVPNIVINSATSSCFRTGESGIISVNIKNTGDQSGTYKVYATCSNPFSVTQPSFGSLNSGESTNVNLPLSASATTKTQSTCTVSVETTGGTKTYSASVCVDPQITCTIPYPQKFCGFSGSSEAIYQCSSNGATRNLVQLCNSDEYCDLGECKLKGTSSGGSIIGGIENAFGKLGNILTIIKWILLVLASLVALVFGRNLSDKYLIKEDKLRWVSWVLGIILGIAVGLVAYLLLLTWIFWVIVAGLIVIYVVLPLVFPELKLLSKLRQ